MCRQVSILQPYVGSVAHSVSPPPVLAVAMWSACNLRSQWEARTGNSVTASSLWVRVLLVVCECLSLRAWALAKNFWGPPLSSCVRGLHTCIPRVRFGVSHTVHVVIRHCYCYPCCTALVTMYMFIMFQCIVSQYQFSDEEGRKEFLDALFSFLTMKGIFYFFLSLLVKLQCFQCSCSMHTQCVLLLTEGKLECCMSSSWRLIVWV